MKPPRSENPQIAKEIVSATMNDQMKEITDAIEATRYWRNENGYAGRGGVIAVFNRQVQGWVDQLRNPEHWQPTCIAVDEVGICWRARGGNARDGAMIWAPVN